MTYTWDTVLYSMREGPQNVQIALLLPGPRRPGPGMLAQMAFGALRSRPHAASKPKRAAQTTCNRAMQAQGLQSTGGGSTLDAIHLLDLHRWPRSKSAGISIDDLRARGTRGEGQHRAAGCRRSSRSKVHTAHTGRVFEESGSGLRQGWASPRLSPG